MIVRVPNGFKVMTTDTGKFHSNDPLPYATAVKQLQALHINTGEGRPRGSGRDWYLEAVKAKARHFGLSDDIEYSTDKTHKFQIHTPEGYIRRFGLRGYNDFLLWSKEEADGKVPKGTANEHRKSYRRRALLIKGNWKADPYSPNNLAINLLW